jgi:hypothetical protein
MMYASLELLTSIKSHVVAQYTDEDGSIMYMGSIGNKHYFKSRVTRREVVIITIE